MRKPLCIKCQTQFRVIKVGITVVAMFSDPPQPYNLTKADLLECPGCGTQIAAGYGKHPYVRHHESDFQSCLAHANDIVREYTGPQPITTGGRMSTVMEVMTLREHLCKAAECIAEKPAKQWAGWVVFLLEELEARDDDLSRIYPCFAEVGQLFPCSEITKPAGQPCIDHKPRETPLLVDVLRNTLLCLLVEFDHLVDHGAEPCDEDCAEEARAALVRYDKEVGDA